MPTTPALDQQALDTWLLTSLRRQHDDVLREPVPDALLRLLDPEHDR